MATVKLTQDLKKKILEKASEPYTAKIETFKAQLSSMESIKSVMEFYAGPTVWAHVKALGAHWIFPTYAGKFWVPYISSDTGLKMKVVWQFSFPRNYGVLAPANMNHHEDTGKVPLIKGPEAFLSVFQEYKNVEHEKEQLEKKITALMDGAVYLKRLIEVWPTVLDLVPQETKEQHYKKPVKVEYTPPEMDDATKLAITKAKILT